MKDDKVYLQHIIDNCDFIFRHTQKDRVRFLNDELVRDAVLRNLQTLAESSTRLSHTIKQANPQINWRDISGFRNVLAHDYLGLDLNIIWDVVEQDLPTLHQTAKTLLSEIS